MLSSELWGTVWRRAGLPVRGYYQRIWLCVSLCFSCRIKWAMPHGASHLIRDYWCTYSKPFSKLAFGKQSQREEVAVFLWWHLLHPCQRGASFLVTFIKNSVVPVPSSWMLKFKWSSINNLVGKMATGRIKVIYIPRKISVLKFSHAVSAEEVRAHKTGLKYFLPDIFEIWKMIY